MSCDFLERHCAGDETLEAFERHRAECAECRRASSDLVRLAALVERLAAPLPSAAAVAAWKDVPRRTVDCDTASEWTARALEEPLSESERARWDGHLARCADCAETAAVLGILPRLRQPESAPAIARPEAPRSAAVVSLAAERARRRRSAWLDPRLYAAAACLLAGFFALFANSLDLGDATRSLGREARVRWAETSDRFRIFEQEASRRLVATRESLTGYTKAAGAIALSAAGRATEGLFHNNEPKTEKGNKS